MLGWVAVDNTDATTEKEVHRRRCISTNINTNRTHDCELKQDRVQHLLTDTVSPLWKKWQDCVQHRLTDTVSLLWKKSSEDEVLRFCPIAILCYLYAVIIIFL